MTSTLCATVATGICILALSLLILNRHHAALLDEQSPTVARRKAQCLRIRGSIEDVRSSLLSDRADLRHWGHDGFRILTHDDWAIVNTCASESIHVGDSSCLDNLPCQIHALDWALVNIR
jgi:hypothetical protein